MEFTAHTPHDTRRDTRRDTQPARARVLTPAPSARAGVSRDGVAGDDGAASLQRGYVSLDAALLRSLRQARMFSQQDLADDCWRRNIRLSLTTIKRAEAGRAVRFRIAREFARCFDLPVAHIANLGVQAVPADA